MDDGKYANLGNKWWKCRMIFDPTDIKILGGEKFRFLIFRALAIKLI
jgi:hypothetical protein